MVCLDEAPKFHVELDSVASSALHDVWNLQVLLGLVASKHQPSCVDPTPSEEMLASCQQGKGLSYWVGRFRSMRRAALIFRFVRGKLRSWHRRIHRLYPWPPAPAAPKGTNARAKSQGHCVWCVIISMYVG
jgi:hypothetical protein